MIVVSDTSAVTNLIAIQRDDLLPRLFGEVLVPPAVWRELRCSHDQLPPFIQLKPIHDENGLRLLLAEGLDDGEAEAIVLAEEVSADLLLIDETHGRRIAQERRLHTIGVLGVLARAKREGYIPAVAPEIDALVRKARFWVSDGLRKKFLHDLGEA